MKRIEITKDFRDGDEMDLGLVKLTLRDTGTAWRSPQGYTWFYRYSVNEAALLVAGTQVWREVPEPKPEEPKEERFSVDGSHIWERMSDGRASVLAWCGPLKESGVKALQIIAAALNAAWKKGEIE